MKFSRYCGIFLCAALAALLAGAARCDAPGDEARGERILVAYFTWAENARPSGAAEVDAVTSASLAPPGNAGLIASWIAEETGGTLFPIIAEEPYPSDFDECLARVREEKQSGARPAIKDLGIDAGEYGVIFLGYPNWGCTAPMPVFTFIEKYGMSGKTIIPFCTYGTGGAAESIRELRAALPASAEMKGHVGVYRDDVAGARGKITEWLKQLGY
ncbi:flavodoxin [Cloacibacillus sp. An23]|uniref:flavodoxin n=1 Tax=Cloacibacillus sp. An23 TaxID=1965591 RepID=UPI000B390E21|nr:flavodoxin [Cloacibacillus sp. An23]OUO93073.1 hypothetical protein B5F39_09525 [Cloacibacillus sp. An23]